MGRTDTRTENGIGAGQSDRTAVRLTAAPYLLLQGDALHTTACLREETLDLIYVDPPFFTGRPHRSGRGTGFSDVWQGSLDEYLIWLIPRIAQMRCLLAPSGSLFVHLDWHAVHAVKVALDDLFGRKLFINEIVWSYRTGGTGTRHLARKHDTILFYARSPHYKFHRLRERSELSHKYGFANAGVRIDERGPYRMTLLRDVWELPALRGNSPERVPFPTQKPLALLKRIVSLVTDPGDLVGDFFCGSGTTLHAALDLGRACIGADMSARALELTRKRLAART
jgi:DNA modification methylase